MIEAYWNEMFGEFKTGERVFSLPGLPEPLMSPHFGRKNIIGNCEGDAHQSFFICGFPSLESDPGVGIEVFSLKDVISSEEFWNYQETYHEESYQFMRRLLPFLVEHDKPHYFFSLRSGGEIAATAIGGEGPTKCLLFNLKVREEFRQKGLARQVLQGAQFFFRGKETLYWTKHPWLTLGSEDIEEYHLCI